MTNVLVQNYFSLESSQLYFGDSIDISDVFQDYESLVEFLVFFGTSVPPYRHRLMGSS